MAWRFVNELMTVMVLLTVTAMTLQAGGVSVSDILPFVQKILKQDPGAAACFLMKTPPKRCFQVMKRSSIKPEAQFKEVAKCSVELGCRPSRSFDVSLLVEDGGGDPSKGPKGFYNSW